MLPVKYLLQERNFLMGMKTPFGIGDPLKGDMPQDSSLIFNQEE